MLDTRSFFVLIVVFILLWLDEVPLLLLLDGVLQGSLHKLLGHKFELTW